MKKFILFALVALLIAAPLFANGSSEATAPTTSVGAQTTVTKGGTLVVAVTADAASMTPAVIRSPTNLYYASVCFETIMRYDENGIPQPFLAESLKEDVAAKTYTIQLKKGILFHDGTELTAEVCKWNIDTYKATGVMSSSFFSKLESVEVTGPYTVVLHLTEWDSLIPNALARECGYMVSKEAYEKDPKGFNENPVGTGAFKFKSWEHGVSMTFEKFDKYWQGEPNLDEVQFVIYKQELVAQAALLNDEIHIMSPLSFNVTDSLKAQGYNVSMMKVPQTCYQICINCVEDSPLADVRVRKAMAYAMNADEIIPVLFGSYATATNQYGVPGSTFYSNDNEIKYDLEKAKQLIKEAGYENGFTTKLIVVNSERSIKFCQIIQEQLAAIGITVELSIVDGGAYMKAIDTWDSGLLLHTMSVYNGINSQLYGFFRKDSTSFGTGSLLHPDDIDSILRVADAATSEESAALFQQAQKLIFDDYCMLRALCVTYQAYVSSPKLHDCGYAENTPYYSNFYTAWLEK